MLRMKKKKNNHFAIIVLGIVVLIIGAVSYFVFSKPTATQPQTQNQTQITPLPYSNEILVTSPTQNEKVISPIKITGKAKGTWYFEGTFTAELFDSNNTSLGTVQVNAKGDWMSEEFVPFEGDLTFTSPATKMGKLIIKKDNPSGLPENEKKLEIPVTF